MPPLLRHAATWGAKYAAAQLGARRVPGIRFAKATTETLDVKGAASIGGADIRIIVDDLSLAAAAGIAAHETWHSLGDEDEGKATATQRAAKAAWTAHRYEQRAQIRRQLEELYDRICPSGRWEGEASARIAAAWYGSKTIGYTAALVLADRDLGLRLEEFQQIERDGLGDEHAFQTVEARRPHAARAAYSYE